MRELWDMFLAFARIGGLTFGGGYAMLPMLQREVVEKHHWATEEELADYYAIGQCTPGVIAVNTATFIGYRQAGVIGGIFATLGVVFPSVVIITVIAAFLTNFADLLVIRYAFEGIRVCVCVLIFNAVQKLWKKSVIDQPTTAIFLLVFLVSAGLAVGQSFYPDLFSVSPIVYVVIAGVAGVVLHGGNGKKEVEK
ncbi:MAG: chromate transporter [Lachnospiraceae bacterium]|jgi:chromate transporter|nr:chromate transporter [Lachnospiraceae bacterium]